jgi:spore germination cell wall hydrolase CwlJ-like protein
MAKPYWKYIYLIWGAAVIGAYAYGAPRPGDRTAQAAAPSAPVKTAVTLQLPDVEQQKAITCLAQAIYYEARGETVEGQRAVGNVVLNRVSDPRYPKTVCAVVFQNEHARHRCQFSFACDGLSDHPPNSRSWRHARKLATKMLTSKRRDDTGNATHYHANYVQPHWASELQPTVDIGHHLFYRDKRRTDVTRDDQAQTDTTPATPQS